MEKHGQSQGLYYSYSRSESVIYLNGITAIDCISTISARIKYIVDSVVFPDHFVFPKNLLTWPRIMDPQYYFFFTFFTFIY